MDSNLLVVARAETAGCVSGFLVDSVTVLRCLPSAVISRRPEVFVECLSACRKIRKLAVVIVFV